MVQNYSLFAKTANNGTLFYATALLINEKMANFAPCPVNCGSAAVPLITHKTIWKPNESPQYFK
jgi:hypothetical protein